MKQHFFGVLIVQRLLSTSTKRTRRFESLSRVSLLLGCGAGGTKIPLDAIGGALLTHVGQDQQGQNRRAEPSIRYFASRKGWMTTDIFSTILRDLESRCAKSKKPLANR